MGGPEMAPHTPRRSSRPGKAVARLDNPPHTPQRSSRPGNPGAPRSQELADQAVHDGGQLVDHPVGAVREPQITIRRGRRDDRRRRGRPRTPAPARPPDTPPPFPKGTARETRRPEPHLTSAG